MDALKSLGINPVYLLSYIVNFFILAFLLSKFLYKPVLGMLDKRRAKIEKGLEDARAAEEARANAEAERQRVLGAAQTEAQQLRADASRQAEQAGGKIKAEAQAEAERIKADAQVVLSAERDKMLGEMRGQIAALAIAAANKLIGESLDRKRQEALIDDFFARVPAQVRTDLAGVSGPMAVTSAVPLTPAEQARVKDELGASQVDFQVEPAILGGLRVRAGDRIVDGSVAGQLDALRSSLG
ncbi:MAG: F0F1 ATP synthase subunit B [Thermoflexales bacterium]|nr:F0F1 ATP synthase subunit B [Thermoflexales bacterium]